MITCPWCGTTYVNFQSTCSRCGGPMDAAHSKYQNAEADGRVLMPPPPPREIAENYHWKLLLADGWTIAAGIFILIGGIFFIVGVPLTIGIVTAFVGLPFALMGLGFLAGGGYVFYWRYNEALKTARILKFGLAMLGQVTGVSENYSVQVNGRNPWRIDYQFTLNGQEYQKSLTTLNPPGPRVQPRREICVLHLPDAPEYNTLYPHP